MLTCHRSSDCVAAFGFGLAMSAFLHYVANSFTEALSVRLKLELQPSSSEVFLPLRRYCNPKANMRLLAIRVLKICSALLLVCTHPTCQIPEQIRAGLPQAEIIASAETAIACKHGCHTQRPQGKL
jgi:hypothetical protein